VAEKTNVNTVLFACEGIKSSTWYMMSFSKKNALILVMAREAKKTARGRGRKNKR